jgi:DNA-binding Xre family transcriptional regulator
MIKKMLQHDNTRLKMIAKQFGITHTQLNRIRSGENWSYVKIDE